MSKIQYSVDLLDISTKLKSEGKGISDFIDSVKTTYEDGCNYFMVVVSHPITRYMKVSSTIGEDKDEKSYANFWLSPWLDDPEVYDVEEFEEVDEETHPDYFHLDLTTYHPDGYVFVKTYKRERQTSFLFVSQEPFFFKESDLIDVPIMV